jgi:hypothetical protein
VGSRAGLYAVLKRKTLSRLCLELDPDLPARSPVTTLAELPRLLRRLHVAAKGRCAQAC